MSEADSKNQNKAGNAAAGTAPAGPPLDKAITAAVMACCDALRDLPDADSKRRVLQSVATVIGLNTATGNSRPAPQRQQQNQGQRNNGGR
jgi:hypothetical protein